MALLRDPNGSQAVELVKGTCDKVFLGGWWALGWLVVTGPIKRWSIRNVLSNIWVRYKLRRIGAKG